MSAKGKTLKPEELPDVLQAKRKLTQEANLEYLKQVNEYANLAYTEGQAKGNEPDKIRYAIQVITDMQDRCDTPEETIERLNKKLLNFEDEAPF